MAVLLIALTLLTLAMCGANNASNSAGTIAGSKILSYRNGILVFVAGLALGVILEGNKLSNAIQGNIVQGIFSDYSLSVILGVTFAMILIATAARLPLPITQAVVGASIGSAFYLGMPLNLSGLLLIAVSWALAPFVAAGVSMVLSKVLRKYRIKSLGGTVVIYGIITLAASFYTAYVFGANTLGTIVGVVKDDLGVTLALGIAIVAASAGAIIVGQRVSRTVGEGVSSLGPATAFSSQVGGASTVHILTQLAVPVSISQSIVGGVYGAGLGKGRRALSRNTAVKLVILWAGTPIFSIIMAWLLHAVIFG
jgi:PiT family inorganic phosphate transporter